MGKTFLSGLAVLLAASSTAPADSSGPVRKDEALKCLRRFIRAHPKVEVLEYRTLDRASATRELRGQDPDGKDEAPYGFSMRCRVDGKEVSELTRFRRELKNDPRLKALLPVVIINVDWIVSGEDRQEYTHVTLSLVVLGRRRITSP
jgi:hypothetical protein